MKKCNVCGTENEDSFSTCLICGAVLDAGEKAEDTGDNINGQTERVSGFKLKAVDTVEQDNVYNQSGTYNQPGAYPQSGAYNQSGMYNPNVNLNQADGMPVKADKKKIFIALGAITAVTVLALFLIFGLSVKEKVAEGGKDSPEDVARDFIEGISEYDADKLMALVPPFMDEDRDSLEEMLDMFREYNTVCKYLGAESTTYSSSELHDLEDEVYDYYGVRVSLDGACDLEVSMYMTMTYEGETQSAETTQSLTVIKYQGKWFLYE